MIHGTAPLLFAEPRYAWTYKHIGVVQYINLHGALDASIDIYHNWPGFFALAAWFGRIAGINTPLAYAAWPSCSSVSLPASSWGSPSAPFP